MLSSIKHRKNASTPRRSNFVTQDDDGADGRRAALKAGASSLSSFTFILFIAVAALIVVIVSFMAKGASSSPSSLVIKTQFASHGLRSEGGGGGGGDSSWSTTTNRQTLQTLIDKQSGTLEYGRTPLIGDYALGKEYNLQPNGDDVTSSGIIHFPSVDLSSFMIEDATNTELQQKLMVFRQPHFSFLQKTTDVDEGTLFEGIINPFLSTLPASTARDTNFALLTLCGYKVNVGGKTPNQDRSIIVQFALDATVEGTNPSDTTKEALLAGIFDGHGEQGHVVSHYIALELPRVFADKMRQVEIKQSAQQDHNDDTIRQAFKEAFQEVDDNEPVKGTGGSTASVIFYPGTGSKLYLANVGDSTIILARRSKSMGESTIVKQNRKDKPHLEDERKRIESAGGQVFIPPSLSMQHDASDYGPQESSRLLIPVGGQQMALAMSRSIGDFDGKSVGLIAEPTVEIFEVNEYYTNNNIGADDSEWFVVIASDGMYDVIPPDEVVQHLGQSLYGENDESSLLESCELLIRKAGRLWMKASVGTPYRDDITLGVSQVTFA
eukprot:g3269.t1 g3269   contig12:1746319-1747971(+)